MTRHPFDEIVARSRQMVPSQLVMLLEPDKDDPDRFVVTVEKLPGLVSHGRGMTEAVANGFEAISAFLGSLAKSDAPLPQTLTVVTKLPWPARDDSHVADRAQVGGVNSLLLCPLPAGGSSKGECGSS